MKLIYLFKSRRYVVDVPPTGFKSTATPKRATQFPDAEAARAFCEDRGIFTGRYQLVDVPEGKTFYTLLSVDQLTQLLAIATAEAGVNMRGDRNIACASLHFRLVPGHRTAEGAEQLTLTKVGSQTVSEYGTKLLSEEAA